MLFFALITAIFAQSIKITPKKVVYTRKLPNISKYKRNFEITYPVITGSMPQAAKQKLEKAINYWRVFETSLKDSMEDTYLSSLDYKVNYNKNGILDVSLVQEGAAAYPSTQIVNLVIDLKTGEQVKFNDVFKESSLVRLAQSVNKKLDAEKAKIIRNIKAGKYNDGEGTEDEKANDVQMIRELKFTAENFNEFSVSDNGITILYDADFPHVIQAIQPEGRYFFTRAQIKPFIKPAGLLGKFVR